MTNDFITERPTWQEKRGAVRTVDEDGTVRYDGMVAIRESIENKIRMKTI